MDLHRHTGRDRAEAGGVGYSVWVWERANALRQHARRSPTAKPTSSATRGAELDATNRELGALPLTNAGQEAQFRATDFRRPHR